MAVRSQFDEYSGLGLSSGWRRPLRPRTFRLLGNGPLIPRLGSMWTVLSQADGICTLSALGDLIVFMLSVAIMPKSYQQAIPPTNPSSFHSMNFKDPESPSSKMSSRHSLSPVITFCPATDPQLFPSFALSFTSSHISIRAYHHLHA